MRLKDYSDRDGKKVWLSESEMGRVLEATDSVREELALLLALLEYQPLLPLQLLDLLLEFGEDRDDE